MEKKKLRFNIIGLILFSAIGISGGFMRANNVDGARIVLAIAGLGAITVLILNMVLIYRAMKGRMNNEKNINQN